MKKKLLFAVLLSVFALSYAEKASAIWTQEDCIQRCTERAGRGFSDCITKNCASLPKRSDRPTGDKKKK